MQNFYAYSSVKSYRPKDTQTARSDASTKNLSQQVVSSTYGTIKIRIVTYNSYWLRKGEGADLCESRRLSESCWLPQEEQHSPSYRIPTSTLRHSSICKAASTCHTSSVQLVYVVSAWAQVLCIYCDNSDYWDCIVCYNPDIYLISLCPHSHSLFLFQKHLVGEAHDKVEANQWELLRGCKAESGVWLYPGSKTLCQGYMMTQVGP